MVFGLNRIHVRFGWMNRNNDNSLVISVWLQRKPILKFLCIFLICGNLFVGKRNKSLIFLKTVNKNAERTMSMFILAGVEISR